MSASIDDRRPAELVASLAAVRTHLADATAAAGREPWSVTLIAVTKTFPVTDIEILLGLGVIDIAESRDQEARAKLAQLHATDARVVRPGTEAHEPRLHFVGRLQTNKCRAVAQYAHTVHTVDRVAVADALADGVQVAQRGALPVFVQISLDGDPDRGGIVVDDLWELADHVAADDRLRLLGVMAVAPIGVDSADSYGRVAEISDRLRQAHPGAVNISAGMSGDFEVAIRAGATHVRIGSALLGHREVTLS